MTDYIQMARTAAASKGHTLKDIPEPETVEFLQAFAQLVRNAALEEAKEILRSNKIPEPRKDYEHQYNIAIQSDINRINALKEKS